MRSTLDSTLPWWIAGPILGLVIISLLGLANKRFGVLGGVTDVVQGSSEGRGLRSWRTLLLAGVVLGAQLGAGRVYALAVAAGVLAGVRLQPRLAGALVRASERSDAAIPAVQAADVL
jgi:hypothetical protein